MKLKVRFSAAALCLLLILSMTGCSDAISSALEDAGLLQEEKQVESASLEDVPEYSGDEYIEIDGGVPDFSDDEDFQPGYEYYSDLDSLERCGLTEALVGPETMPTEERGSIGMIKPTGWHTVRYDFVDGKYLYNRCHLIGFQLAGENANEKNLITGTRYMNTEGMLPFEDEVAEYVRETGNHVMYRVTPIFDGDDLVAKGVQMEAKSVEDDTISFNVFVYNIQPGVEIDYATGENWEAGSDEVRVSGETDDDEAAAGKIRGNKRSRIYHTPDLETYDDMEGSKNLILFDTEEEAQKAGYRKAQR